MLKLTIYRKITGLKVKYLIKNVYILPVLVNISNTIDYIIIVIIIIDYIISSIVVLNMLN